MTETKTQTTVKTPSSKIKVGIPRGLFFFKFFPLWKAFLEYLNCDVVVSSPTTSKIVEEGAKAALSELCVPMKIYFGHVQDLLKEYPDIDYVFVPRYISTHKGKFFCPKFMILPEQVKHGFNMKKPMLTLEVDARNMKGIEGAIKLGKELGFSQEITAKAWYFAFEKFKNLHEKAKKSDWLDHINELDTDPKHHRNKTQIKQMVPESVRGKFPVNVLLLGHAYNVYETYINMDMIARLRALDANVITMEQMPDAIFEKPVIINKEYENYWENEEEILQTARYFLRDAPDDIDGIIFLISFACGPDSLIQELIMRDMQKRKIPFLALILDEHSGEGGLVTRIESFVDMIRREKYGDV
jgi:predicted nucleotide-binding protein (sugar kinase/HSP70/actin superfamily)